MSRELQRLDALYLDKIRDLVSRRTAGTYADLIQAAAILRILFIDGNPIVSAVNRERRLLLKFEIMVGAEIFVAFGDVPWIRESNLIHWSRIDPTHEPKDSPSRKVVTRDGFLKAYCGTSGGHAYNVRQVIQLGANVLGGIHYDNEPDEFERAMIDSEKLLIMNGLGPAIASIRDIAAVAIAGLEPLTAVIRHSSES